MLFCSEFFSVVEEIIEIEISAAEIEIEIEKQCSSCDGGKVPQVFPVPNFFVVMRGGRDYLA